MTPESLSRAFRQLERVRDDDPATYGNLMDSLGLTDRIRLRVLAEVGEANYPLVIFGMALALRARDD